MVRISFTVTNLSYVLTYFNRLNIYRSDAEGGPYVEITTSETRIVLVPGREQYFFTDETGTATSWYRATYYNADTMEESAQSTPIQGGVIPGTPDQQTGKIGWTFENYSPPPGEWGEVYTADDIRYTMLWGIDSVASNIAQDEFEDSQFRQIVREAVSEFEEYLTIDIVRRKYVTYPDASLVQSRVWREGVDYTDTDDPYDFDPQGWSEYGFVQLRHGPIIAVNRAVWYSPVKGEIMNMIDNNWLRLHLQSWQVRMFPTTGFNYGPYAGAFGPLWSHNFTERYPGGFEFDYETGYKTAEFVPEGLRGTIGKYAAIKALAVVGDGLLAGFSSQSVSLDGLSESFSSTQSATSAYFGARIAQYSKEIEAWLQRNRYKFAPPPISFV